MRKDLIGFAAGIALVLAASPTASAQSVASQLTSNPNGIAAVELLDMVFNQKKVEEAFAKYVGDTYTQHNPMVPDGIDGAVTGLTALLKQMPGWKYDFKRVLVDGDLVAVHAHITTGPDDRGMAVVDIFRVKDDKFVEHWDVLQPVPEKSANTNTMF
jgi:predicted SnoaL-like aldol condensation-catalyzing enzyme